MDRSLPGGGTEMITDKLIADLCVGIYRYPDQPAVDFDHSDDGRDDDVCWARKQIDGVHVIVLRGSVTLEDWLRDFFCFANPFSHFALGPVHPGFLAGMAGVWRDIKAQIGDAPVIVCGHSLGAARASILAGLMEIDGHPPIARVVFGEPKPGFAVLARIVAGIPGCSYFNVSSSGHDGVCDVPASFPPEEYIHPTPLMSVSQPPTAAMLASWGRSFAHHHMVLYAAAAPDTQRD